jgi:hypothetical protein
MVRVNAEYLLDPAFGSIEIANQKIAFCDSVVEIDTILARRGGQ